MARSEEDVGPACVTVMMSVAARAARDRPADATEAHFSAVARDAMAWTKRKAGGSGDRTAEPSNRRDSSEGLFLCAAGAGGAWTGG